MVPLQAVKGVISTDSKISSPWREQLTKFLLDDLEDFLLVELLRKTLNCRQSLTTIAFWATVSMLIPRMRLRGP